VDRVCSASGVAVAVLHVGNPSGVQSHERHVWIRVVRTAAQPGRDLECTLVHGPDAVRVQQVGAVDLLDLGIIPADMDVGRGCGIGIRS